MSLLNIESQAFQKNFPSHPFVIRHTLTGHPMFALERLLELGRVLPAHEIEYNAGDLNRINRRS